MAADGSWQGPGGVLFGGVLVSRRPQDTIESPDHVTIRLFMSSSALAFKNENETRLGSYPDMFILK